MQVVIETALRHAGGAAIVTLRLELGQLAGVAVEALRFCFDVCSRGTALEGAVLEIADIPARARCRACGVEADFETWVSACACGSLDRELICGREILIKELEVMDVS